MICEQCNNSFDPPQGVARLIVTKKIPQLCDACAKQKPSLFTSIRPRASQRRTLNSVLRQVDLFEPDGTTTRGMSLMPDYPKINKKRVPRPGRLGDKLRVFVLSERSGQITGHPNTRLFTNLETFQRQGRPFKAWKAPGRAEALTGIDHIELCDVVRVEDEGLLEVNIFSRDASRVRLLYRN